jgi:hypothetical protein
MRRTLNVAIPDADAELLERLAERMHRRAKDHAEALLIDALRRTGDGLEARIQALADAFDAEGERLYRDAESLSVGPRRRLLLQTQAETWFRAAVRLRLALATPDPRSAQPDQRSTAA